MPAESKYYVLTVEADSKERRKSLEENNKAEPLSSDAEALINSGIKIAFQPPDRCLNTTATPEGAVKKEDYIGMECGVLMTSLELAAAKAGYEVVSWQGLKDIGMRPLAKAATLKVDVLVEVNELSANERQSGKSSYTGLAFYEQSSLTDRRALQVSPSVAQNCKAYVDQMVKDGYLDLEENSATLDAKAVDVKTGRAIWYYSKTIRDEKDPAAEEAELPESDFYYQAAASAPPTHQVEKYNPSQVTGAVLVPTGSFVAVVGGVLHWRTEREAGGTVLLATGMTALTMGATTLIFGNLMNRRYNERPVADRTVLYTPTYQAPPEVLCTSQMVRPPFLPQLTAPSPVQGGGSAASSYTYTEQTDGSSDAERALRERLIKMVAKDFVVELTKLN